MPQLGTTSRLDAIGDRGMFRLAYRNFGDHEALVGNQTVSSGGVAGIRWYEISHGSDPANTLGQSEATLFTGAGSQTGTSNRWGDYSDLTVDPVDDCTSWYTQEYYSTTSSFNWRTRIGTFTFPTCGGTPPPRLRHHLRHRLRH